MKLYIEVGKKLLDVAKDMKAGRDRAKTNKYYKEFWTVKRCQEEAKKLKDNMDSAGIGWGVNLSGKLIFDTNAWMEDDKNFEAVSRSKCFYYFYGPDPEEGCMASFCKDFGTSVYVPVMILDELQKIKARGEPDSSCHARAALKRIEAFQSVQAVEIDDKHGLQDSGHADPLLMDLALDLGEDGTRVTIVTNDRDLRIRAKARFSNSELDLHCVDLESFEEQVVRYMTIVDRYKDVSKGNPPSDIYR